MSPRLIDFNNLNSSKLVYLFEPFVDCMHYALTSTDSGELT